MHYILYRIYSLEYYRYDKRFSGQLTEKNRFEGYMNMAPLWCKTWHSSPPAPLSDISAAWILCNILVNTTILLVV